MILRKNLGKEQFRNNLVGAGIPHRMGFFNVIQRLCRPQNGPQWPPEDTSGFLEATSSLLLKTRRTFQRTGIVPKGVCVCLCGVGVCCSESVIEHKDSKVAGNYIQQ